MAARIGYLPGLDGVRALAVVGVLAFHLGLDAAPGGFLGVDVFFVLSGFLITTLLLAELERSGRLDLKGFYIRRARRLLPALFLVLAVTAVLALTVARDAAAQFRADAVAALTYTTNWWYVVDEQSYFEVAGRPPLLQHLWSLSVEEQFYLLWPIVALMLWRWGGRRRVGRVALFTALGSSLLMMLLAGLWWEPAAPLSRLYFGSDTHAMGLLLGAALATVWRPETFRPRLRPGANLAVTGIGMLALLGVLAAFSGIGESTWWLYRGGFLVVAAVSAVLVAAAAHPGAVFGRALAVAPLAYLGQRSYGIYLWHWPVFMVMRPGIDLPFEGAPAAALAVAVTLACAEASYRWVETPIRRGALGAAWASARAHGAVGVRRFALVGAGVTAGVLVAGTALAAVPAPSASDYLGGVTAVGDEDLSRAETDDGAVLAVSRSGASGTTRSAVPVDLTKARISAVGDSVLLGARVAVSRTLPKVRIDAAVSRIPSTIFARIRDRKASGRLESVVVIHAGTNAELMKSDLSRALRGLRDRTRVVVVTVRMPERWMAEVNNAIWDVAPAFPNVRIADWAAVSAGHREYFVYDGVHMTGPGGRAFAATIAAALRAR